MAGGEDHPVRLQQVRRGVQAEQIAVVGAGAQGGDPAGDRDQLDMGGQVLRDRAVDVGEVLAVADAGRVVVGAEGGFARGLVAVGDPLTERGARAGTVGAAVGTA